MTTNPFTRAREAVERAEAAKPVRNPINAPLGNKTADEGVSRCECGSKYWENDRCVDCGTRHSPSRHDQTN